MSALSPQPASGPFSPRTVFILLLVGVTAFVGMGVLTAYAPQLKARTDGGANALSRSAVGYAGLARLLQAEGAPVLISRDRTPPASAAQGLLVLTPPPGTSVKAINALVGRREHPVLVVSPKWLIAADADHPGWARPILPTPLTAPDEQLQTRGVKSFGVRSAAAPVRLHGVGDTFASLGELQTGTVDRLRTLQAPGAAVIVADEAGRAVLVRFGAGTYVLSDPDLLDNRGMASLATARAALAIVDALRGGSGPVVFDVTLDGLGRTRSLLGLALSPPFLGASLCGLATALLMGLHASARFGPARAQARALALGKAALLDNTAALIRLARREPKMGRRYAALVRRALARRVLAAGSADLAPLGDAGVARLDSALDTLTRPGEPPFSQLAREAGEARDTTALMRAARGLHQRQTEILGERR